MANTQRSGTVINNISLSLLLFHPFFTSVNPHLDDAKERELIVFLCASFIPQINDSLFAISLAGAQRQPG